MIFTDSKDFNKGRYCAIRRINEDGTKSNWLEPMCSVTMFIDNPKYEVVMYTDPTDELPE